MAEYTNPVDNACPTCDREGIEITTMSDPQRRYRCIDCAVEWFAPWGKNRAMTEYASPAERIAIALEKLAEGQRRQTEVLERIAAGLDDEEDNTAHTRWQHSPDGSLKPRGEE